ncbi:MAG TPA: adenine deaminase [Chloroflexota bacterium]
MNSRRLVSVARGETAADLLLRDARVVNTFTGEVERGNVAVSGGLIAGVGDYSEAREVVDLGGRYLSPGLLDAHVHVESSLLNVDQYARAVVPRGVLAVVTDLHEIANVTGLDGVRYVADGSRRLPMDIFFTAPSCVPASDLETSGARLTASDLKRLYRSRAVVGLGEMMDYLGVLGGDGATLEKIRTARGAVDGHAPGLTGRALNGYIAPGVESDHESVDLEEGREKLRRGLHLMIREGSAERNLEALLPLVTDRTYHRCMFVVDDRDPLDIWREGDLDSVVRRAISLGLDPVRAIQLASLNPARYFGLKRLGAIAPGYWANLAVISDLERFEVEDVYYRGRRVASRSRSLFDDPLPLPDWIVNTVRVKPFSVERLALHASGRTFPAIEIVPRQILTRRVDVEPKREGSVVVADPSRDLLKVVVVERHHATGNIGVALVKGFGLKRGAIGSSVAHDSHNIVVVGVGDADIYAAVRAVEAMQGGLVCVLDGQVSAALPLPIAGLLSAEPLEAVVEKVQALEEAARALGCRVEAPYSVLSFLPLSVIPELRITDRGLVDASAGRLL